MQNKIAKDLIKKANRIIKTNTLKEPQTLVPLRMIDESSKMEFICIFLSLEQFSNMHKINTGIFKNEEVYGELSYFGYKFFEMKDIIKTELLDYMNDSKLIEKETNLDKFKLYNKPKKKIHLWYKRFIELISLMEELMKINDVGIEEIVNDLMNKIDNIFYIHNYTCISIFKNKENEYIYTPSNKQSLVLFNEMYSFTSLNIFDKNRFEYGEEFIVKFSDLHTNKILQEAHLNSELKIGQKVTYLGDNKFEFSGEQSDGLIRFKENDCSFVMKFDKFKYAIIGFNSGENDGEFELRLIDRDFDFDRYLSLGLEIPKDKIKTIYLDINHNTIYDSEDLVSDFSQELIDVLFSLIDAYYYDISNLENFNYKFTSDEIINNFILKTSFFESLIKAYNESKNSGFTLNDFEFNNSGLYISKFNGFDIFLFIDNPDENDYLCYVSGNFIRINPKFLPLKNLTYLETNNDAFKSIFELREYDMDFRYNMDKLGIELNKNN